MTKAKHPLATPLCEKLGMELPIIQAPIGGVATPELVAAVCNAGGFGFHPLSWHSQAQIEETVAATRRLTNRPFGANLVLQWDQQERLDFVLAAGVKVVSFFWGDPAPYLAKTRAAGALTTMTVGSVAEAKRAADLGIDVIIAQGVEAGGHVWSKVSTLSLVPTVVDAVPHLPVVAAGGIADGRGLAAVLALGAEAAWMGTRFVASQEADSHDFYRQRLIKARETDAVLNTLFDEDWRDAPLRSLKNSTYRTWRDAGKPPRAARPGKDEVLARRADGTPVPRYQGISPSRDMEGDLEALALYAGQGVGLIKDIRPAGEIVRQIADDALKALRNY